MIGNFKLNYSGVFSSCPNKHEFNIHLIVYHFIINLGLSYEFYDEFYYDYDNDIAKVKIVFISIRFQFLLKTK